ncbi:putative polyamine oxidase 4 [Tetrabaena socialis]|uniref:Putative polyamine oxidase 4 n=1 Tax=Tetrabaena socialis TaxID=47790 RepID=A0A2J7ZVI7_9CHLO|nr:putative polyamine oxidase 4 [Tetrabaena socialis]|eukprot:PNH04269.1 putative polyamine oxidase 4 [Tetrabaena socialis]
MAESFHSVAIVGAGVSGLYAAHLLRARFPDVVLLEAQNRIGGRIKQVHGFAPWPVEVGPEFVHGRNSTFVRLAESAMGVQLREKDWPDFWHFGAEGGAGGQGLVADANVDDEVAKVHDLFGNCDEEPLPPPGRDVSAVDWMRSKGCSQRQMAIADACYANDFCCSLRHLGLREMILENRGWDSGETYLLMDRSLGEVIQHLAKGADVRTNWAVQSIEYGGPAAAQQQQGGVTIRAVDGRVVRCRAVVVTVALPILQQNLITFSPPLPPAKTAALSRLRMGNVVKLLLSFSSRFWPEDMYDVLCPGAFVPEFWMLRYPETNPGVGTPFCIVGFIAGERADEASAIASAPASPATAPHPLEPFVRGAYTYPTLGAEVGDRGALAAPVAGRVFFAGEATQEAANPCIQGAMETAERAAAQVGAALEPARSKM